MKYPHPTPEQIEKLPYRPGVGIMLVNQRGQVFVAQRIDNPGPAWQMPQGGIDKREEPLQAAWREMQEEVGTDRARFIGESRDWLTYDLPADLIPQIWKGRFRGQRQKWFAFRFLGTDRDIIRLAYRIPPDDSQEEHVDGLPLGTRGGLLFRHTFPQDAKDFAAFGKTKLTMPMLVLTGEKASGETLITQARLVDDHVDGVVIKGSGHWLMEEATDQVMPKLVAFLKK